MFTSKRFLSYAGLAAAVLGVAVSPVLADYTCNFELGKGKNAQQIGTDVGGLYFSTVGGSYMYYADINSGNYRATSDNGKTVEDGEYFISGDVAAFVPNVTDIGKIDFLNGKASYVTVGYSSGFAFTVEAYSSTGQLVSTASGAANTRSCGGNGLGYLTVNGTGISSVRFIGTGGHWMVDNITTDAPVPEPASIVTLAGALIGVLGLKLGRKGI